MEDIVLDDLELNIALTRASFEGKQELYTQLKAELLNRLVAKGYRRPAPDFKIFRNCIELWLQRAVGDNYYYVPVDKWDYEKYVISLKPVREVILTEIRIGSKALQEALLLETGKFLEDDLGELIVDDNSYL